MLNLVVIAMSGFAPTPMRTQRNPSTVAPRVCMLDPGLVDTAGMIGRASTFGLACYAAMQLVDPPGRKAQSARRRAAVAVQNQQPDEASQRFGWLNADMSVPLPTLQALEQSCVRVGQLRGSTFYLCKEKSAGFQACELSPDFTRHYGESVYICRA